MHCILAYRCPSERRHGEHRGTRRQRARGISTPGRAWTMQNHLVARDQVIGSHFVSAGLTVVHVTVSNQTLRSDRPNHRSWLSPVSSKEIVDGAQLGVRGLRVEMQGRLAALSLLQRSAAVFKQPFHQAQASVSFSPPITSTMITIIGLLLGGFQLGASRSCQLPSAALWPLQIITMLANNHACFHMHTCLAIWASALTHLACIGVHPETTCMFVVDCAQILLCNSLQNAGA